MEIPDLLCQMVRERRMVSLSGAGDPPGSARIAEPHAVYIGSNNRGFVDFYQTGGASKSGKLPGWRRFALSDVTAVQPLQDTFEPRPGYRPENRGFYRAFVCTSAS